MDELHESASEAILIHPFDEASGARPRHIKSSSGAVRRRVVSAAREHTNSAVGADKKTHDTSDERET